MADDPFLQKVGRVVTRAMLHARVRRRPSMRRLYMRLYLMGKFLAERRETAFLRSVVRPGMSIVDVGANVGYYTHLFARLVGPTGRVYAFEPDPFSYDLLAGRTRRAGLKNVRLFPQALGDHEGAVTLYCSTVNRADNRTHPSHQPGIPVERTPAIMTTLDTLVWVGTIARIDAIKMDVQGGEVAALRGMRCSIEQFRPQWLFLEFSPSDLSGAGSSDREFWSLLRDLGYTPHSFDAAFQAVPIADEAAFAAGVGDGYTNVFARCVP